MKTQFLKLTIILLYLGSFATMQAQGLYNLATLNEDKGGTPLKWASDIDFGYDDVYHKFDDGVEWADYTAGGSAGFGWTDNEGSSETTFCFGAEFLAKVLGENQNPKGAGYLGAYANYHIGNSDNFDESLLRAGVKFSYFDRITPLNEAQLIYGVKAFYETGSRNFSGFDDDVNGFGFTAYTGVNFRACEKASIGLEFPIISFLSRTFEGGGNEFKQDNTSIAINKDNPIMAYLRWHL